MDEVLKSLLTDNAEEHVKVSSAHAMKWAIIIIIIIIGSSDNPTAASLICWSAGGKEICSTLRSWWEEGHYVPLWLLEEQYLTVIYRERLLQEMDDQKTPWKEMTTEKSLMGAAGK